MERKFTVWSLKIIDIKDEYNDYVTDQTLFLFKESAIKSAVATMKLYMNWKPDYCEKDNFHIQGLITELTNNNRYYYDWVVVRLEEMNVWGEAN